jgi:uncharacterized NAD-dependent epimerase/dehydratase family protein
MDGTALVLCGGSYAEVTGKTAHGLVRGTDRYRLVGVVDAPTAGRDAPWSRIASAGVRQRG